MNLTNVIQIRELLDSIKRESTEKNPNHFSNIEFNNFRIEFFAGVNGLCEPKVTYDKLSHYKKIQIGIQEIIREQDHMICPAVDSRFSSFEWAKYFTFINNKGQTKPSYMGEMIPIADAVSLIRDVYKVSRLKIFF